MKYILKSAEPEPLREYCKGIQGSWDSFTSGEVCKFVTTQLFSDQRGICAYCEIDLIISDGRGYSDLRVEHFHPKSDGHPTWTFKWSNLILTCCGGNRNYLSNGASDRFTSPDHSCDVPKEDKVLDEIIFHPAAEEALRNLLFSYQMDGRMEVSENCPEALRDKAFSTIKELNLSPEIAVKKSKEPTPRLVRMRSAFLKALEDQVQAHLEEGLSIEDALDILAKSLFPENRDDPWTKFFTCARWYLGPTAEDRLRTLGYLG